MFAKIVFIGCVCCFVAGSVFAWVRVMVANRLAHNASEWVELVARENR